MSQYSTCLHELFECQAEKTPEAVALVDGATERTYRSLDQETDSLAAYLMDRGVSVDDRIGVFMETSADYVVACIGALKAGAAFMPLGIDSPESLLQSILQEAQPKAVITRQQHLAKLTDGSGVPYLALDGGLDWRGIGEGKRTRAPATPESLAFVPYTSGTTGAPKGVMQTHRAAVSSYHARYKFSSYQAGDRVACNIFFIWEFLRPLLRGGTCHVIPDDVIFLPRSLLKYISDHRITEVLLTPSLLQSVMSAVDPGRLKASLQSLQVLWLNGEVVTASLAARAVDTLSEHTRIFNTYSISECHDVATVDLRQASLEGKEACPVGYAMDGVSVRVLADGEDRLAPAATGELYIGGEGLARGYLGRDDLTADRFVTVEGDRFYATGDVAEIDEAGMIEVKGRSDSMVKVRGYSVYLGGIEETLRKHCGVQETVVLVEGEEDSRKRLVAYVVREPGSVWRIDPRTGVSRELRGLLGRHLPQYMVPSRYVELEGVSIDARTGKLDRKSLPPTARTSVPEAYRVALPLGASSEERRRTMRQIWCQVLDLEVDAVDDETSFFDLGGHSLSGIELTLEIERVFGTELEGSEIFDHPTLDELVAFLEPGGKTSSQQISLPADAVLDPRIVPPTTGSCDRLADASSILLTGATGFLGAFLLDELLRATADHVKFYCLVRGDAAGPGSWTERVREALKFYGLSGQEFPHRIVPVAGDLSLTRFGLDDDRYEELAEKIDLVFHCAAAVNYVYPYSALKPHTVGGTQEVLSFACHSRTKPMHYISSNGVFPGGDGTPYTEDRNISGYAERLEGGYNQAKWVAERTVWSAVDRGLPVCIYRPGNIGHHSVTAVFNPRDFQTMLLQACARAGCAPIAPDWYFEMTPVDFLARVIRGFAEDPAHWGKVYNVVQQHPLPADQVFSYLEEKGYVSRRAPVEEWRASLNEVAENQGDHEMRVLAQSLEFVEGYLTDTSVYDCSGFRRALSRMGITMPTVDLGYVTRFLTRS